MLTRCFGHHHDKVETSCVSGSQEHAVALVALADHLAHSLVPDTCDLGYDVDTVDLNGLINASGLTPETVTAENEAFKAAVRKSSIYLDLG